MTENKVVVYVPFDGAEVRGKAVRNLVTGEVVSDMYGSIERIYSKKIINSKQELLQLCSIKSTYNFDLNMCIEENQCIQTP